MSLCVESGVDRRGERTCILVSCGVAPISSPGGAGEQTIFPAGNHRIKCEISLNRKNSGILEKFILKSNQETAKRLDYSCGK